MYIALFYEGGFDDAGFTTAAVVFNPVDRMAVKHTANTCDGCLVICEQMAATGAIADSIASDVYNIAYGNTASDGIQDIVVQLFHGDK